MQRSKQQSQNDGCRNKGAFASSGKIIKGTINQATTKLRVSSIPTRHENIIYAYHSHFNLGQPVKTGFISSYNNQQAPGPGFYNIQQPAKILSKKGSSFFVSKSKLQSIQNAKSYVPGPQSYRSIQKLSQKGKPIEKQKPKKKMTQKVFNPNQRSHQLFKNQIANAKELPSVGLYNLSSNSAQKRLKQTSAFKNNIQRFKSQEQKSPPVGYYQNFPTYNNIKKSNLQLKRNSSETGYEKCNRILNSIKNLQKQKQKNGLGPGYYQTNTQKPLKSFSIKENMHTRFGELKPIFSLIKSLEQEDVKEHYNPENQNRYLYSQSYSVFKSTTKRPKINVQNQMDPGKYNSSKSPQKKSHLINFTQKWV